LSGDRQQNRVDQHRITLAASVLFLALGFWSAYRRRTVIIDGRACPVKASRTVRATLWIAAAASLLPWMLS